MYRTAAERRHSARFARQAEHQRRKTLTRKSREFGYYDLDVNCKARIGVAYLLFYVVPSQRLSGLLAHPRAVISTCRLLRTLDGSDAVIA